MEALDKTLETEDEIDMTEEEYNQALEDLLNDRSREIELDKDSLKETEDFKKGLSNSLYYSGFYTGLRNYGMATNDAYNLTLNEHTCKHNLDLAKVQDKQINELDNTNVIGFQYTPENEYEHYDEE